MLILASQSATRKALLAGAGLRFESSPSPIDERAIENGLLGKHPRALAQQLAGEKALAVSRLNPAATVIGADQVLAFSSLLHKPADLAEARTQLLLLRGKTHHLHAGVALARDGEILWADVETAALTMREFEEADSTPSSRMRAKGCWSPSAAIGSKAPRSICSSASKATISPSSACRC